MPSPMVQPAAEGMPASTPEPSYREQRHRVADAAFVHEMPAGELPILFDALAAMSEALVGIFNRPACREGSAVGAWVEREIERVDAARALVVRELESRPMSGDQFEDDQRIGYVAAWDLRDCGGNVGETLAKLTRMRAAHEDAAFALARSTPRAARAGR